MTAHPKGVVRRNVRPGKSPTHLDNIRMLPCVLSGGPAEACHVRYADAAHGKPDTGAGRRPDDRWTVPMSPMLHRLATESQHGGNERAFWEQFGIDPLALAEKLWEYRHSRITMERVVTMFTPWDQKIKARIMEIMRNGKKPKV